MKIDTHDTDVGSLLNESFYKIPRFQRPYEWDQENVDDFWEDLVADESPDYFIGSMVVFEAPSGVRMVVDGQQRLTTITLLLCALRDAYRKVSLDGKAEALHRLIERPDINNDSLYVLDTESSYPFLQEHIQKWGPPGVALGAINVGPEEQKLQKAHNNLCARVATVVTAVQSDAGVAQKAKISAIDTALTRLRDRVLDLKSILVRLDNEDDAYIIFETLNSRGKDLRVQDLLKNHLMKLHKQANARVDLARDKWCRVLETLEESDANIGVDAFLLHFWLSRHELVSQKQLFKSMRKEIRTSARASSTLDELVSDSALYRRCIETSYGRAWVQTQRPIKLSLDALQLFGMQQPLPFVLSAMRAWQMGVLKPRDVKAYLKAIEDFHFVVTAITSTSSSGGISAMYAKHARELGSASDVRAARAAGEGLKAKLAGRKSSLEEFSAGFAEVLASDAFTKKKRLAKYILYKYETSLGYGAPRDYDQMTIEHLHPQSKTDSDGFSGVTVAMLGNLMLVDQETNRVLSDQTFARKKEILKERGYPLDDLIMAATSWDAAAVKARTEQMASLAYSTIWPVA